MDCPLYDNLFKYQLAIGMLLYNGNNTHSNCTYALNACACPCIAPQKAYAEAAKQIGCYFKSCINDGLIIKDSKKQIHAGLSLQC